MRMPIVATVVCSLLIAALPAYAATGQQDKMKSCNAEAGQKQLKGEERKSFMKTCLTAVSAEKPATVNSQQAKMKTCNADAKTKGLKGDERKAFMKTCLSGG